MNEFNTHGAKDLMMAIIISAVPVAIIILMQNTALRNRMIMRVSLGVKHFSDTQVNAWTALSLSCAQLYQKARL